MLILGIYKSSSPGQAIKSQCETVADFEIADLNAEAGLTTRDTDLAVRLPRKVRLRHAFSRFGKDSIPTSLRRPVLHLLSRVSRRIIQC